MRKYILFFWMIFLVVPSYAYHAKLTHMQINTHDHDIRIALFLDQPAKVRAFVLKNPERFVLDLNDTRLATSLKNLNLTEANIKNIRVGYPSPNMTRIVFDLNHAMQFKLSNQNDEKIIINLSTSKFKKIISHAKNTVLQPAILSINKISAKRPMVVVIDPGHGGHDPGAVGVDGTREKDVTLAIAKKLAYVINQQSNMKAVLTRNGDYFIELRRRLKLARKGNADLFVALHADSYFNDKAYGASIYTLSEHGATTEAARWLARRDNYSELGNVDLKELGDQSALLRSVLIDLAQTATITDSLHLGRMMLSNLRSVTKLHYSQVEQAPFMVLKSPDIPSVLVEMGFISNQSEEQRLRNEMYQDKMALALYNGIQHYFKKYPAGA